MKCKGCGGEFDCKGARREFCQPPCRINYLRNTPRWMRDKGKAVASFDDVPNHCRGFQYLMFQESGIRSR